MFTRNNRTNLTLLVLRWTARGLSVASTAVLLLFIIGEPFDVSRITGKEWVGLALFPLGIVAGFAVAWWKEAWGGAITTVSLVVFCLLFVGSFSRAWAFFAFAFPGLLFVLSGLLSNLWKSEGLQT
jgi:hypothetical protein